MWHQSVSFRPPYLFKLQVFRLSFYFCLVTVQLVPHILRESNFIYLILKLRITVRLFFSLAWYQHWVQVGIIILPDPTYIHTHTPLHFINPNKPLGFGYEKCPHDLTKTVRCTLTNTHKVKVKQSINRPGQFLRVPAGWGYQISRQSAHGDVNVVSPTRRPPLLQGKIPGTYLCWSLSQPQGHSAAGRIV